MNAQSRKVCEVLMRKICLLFLIGFLLVGCQEGLPQNVFDRPVCEPPCWQNIMPGVTTKEAALAILSKIVPTGSTVSNMNEANLKGFDDVDIRFQPIALDDRLTVFVNTVGNRVAVMRFEGQLNIDLQDAIRLFGEPQSVLVVHTSLYDQVTLLNATKGIATGWQLYGSQDVESSAIEPNNELSQVIFFDPNQYQLILDSPILAAGALNTGTEIAKSLHWWTGYGSFKDKYWPPATP